MITAIMKTFRWSAVGAIVIPLALLAADDPSDPFRDMRVPVQTPLVQQFLTDHQVAVLPFLRVGEKSVVVTDKATGTSIRLEDSWKAVAGEKYYRVPDLSKFLATLGLRVSDGKTAIKVAQLIEDLTASAQEIKMAMINKKDFTLFNGRAYTSREAERKNWRYTVEKDKGLWVVMVTYEGPPAMIMVPPVYEIETDRDSQFVEIRKRMRRDRPARKE